MWCLFVSIGQRCLDYGARVRSVDGTLGSFVLKQPLVPSVRALHEAAQGEAVGYSVKVSGIDCGIVTFVDGAGGGAGGASGMSFVHANHRTSIAAYPGTSCTCGKPQCTGMPCKHADALRIKLTSLEVRCGVRCGVCCCQCQCFYIMIPRYFHPLLLPTMTFHVCDAQVSELATFDPRFLVATMRTLYLTNIQRSCVVSNTELRSSKADHLLPPTWQLELIADAVAKVPSHFVQP